MVTTNKSELNFVVWVHPKHVEFRVESGKMRGIHASAIVDGVRFNYYVRKADGGKRSKITKSWYQRAMQRVHRHAHNSGEQVEFLKVSNGTKRKPKPVHPKQLTMF